MTKTDDTLRLFGARARTVARTTGEKTPDAAPAVSGETAAQEPTP